MKQIRAILIRVIAYGVLLGGLAIAYIGIWPPDVSSGKEKVVSRFKTTSGHEFLLCQKWGDYYSYSLRMVHHLPNGTTVTQNFPGDFGKIWLAPKIIVEEKSRRADVRVQGLIYRHTWD